MADEAANAVSIRSVLPKYSISSALSPIHTFTLRSGVISVG